MSEPTFEQWLENNQRFLLAKPWRMNAPRSSALHPRRETRVRP